jgi:hypothetical protein
MTKKNKTIIGRVDKANFPELNLEDVAIKIDTGAYTSSIHCKDIMEDNGILKCRFLDHEHPNYNNKLFTFKEYNTVTVRSSNGVAQKRYEIKSSLKLFGKIYKISLSLSDRKEMRFPVLIGRKFLNNKFVVDPQLKDISFNLQQP